jgi:hypothetical protein
MKIGSGIAVAILALGLATVNLPAQACNGNGNCEYAPGHNKDRGYVSGAPGPIVGAGLPILAIGGFGVYWLIRRRRKHR